MTEYIDIALYNLLQNEVCISVWNNYLLWKILKMLCFLNQYFVWDYELVFSTYIVNSPNWHKDNLESREIKEQLASKRDGSRLF